MFGIFFTVFRDTMGCNMDYNVSKSGECVSECTEKGRRHTRCDVPKESLREPNGEVADACLELRNMHVFRK